VTDLTSVLLIFANVGKNTIALPLSIQTSQELTLGIRVALCRIVIPQHRRKQRKGRVMKPLKNLRNERGQGLMEYTLVVFLVALVFWGGMRTTNIGDELAMSWSNVVACVAAPFSCAP
jgi:Flp pilus assembly pilin Flp